MESERDAHLSAASQYADQLKMIKKKSDEMYTIPERLDSIDRVHTREYRDGKDDIDNYDEKIDRHQYNARKPTHFHHQQPTWEFASSNGRNFNRFKQSSNIDSDGTSNRNDGDVGMTSLNIPRSHKLLQLNHGKQHQTDTSTDNDSFNDLDWIVSNNGLKNIDYDALYDDVNEHKRSSTNTKFDRYRRNDSSFQLKSIMQQPKRKQLLQ